MKLSRLLIAPSYWRASRPPSGGRTKRKTKKPRLRWRIRLSRSSRSRKANLRHRNQKAFRRGHGSVEERFRRLVDYRPEALARRPIVDQQHHQRRERPKRGPRSRRQRYRPGILRPRARRRRSDFQTGGGKTRTLLIGDSNPTGNDVYAKVADDGHLYTMSSSSKTTLDKESNDLRDSVC